ncbi:MAG: sugar phosphate isomerase/epimerase [Clostridiales bacterium]|jgi:sugar phosphate isomerase/epimerase|nr:sugar phosphate isomerase/epimerase [Clostridiales bacterium]
MRLGANLLQARFDDPEQLAEHYKVHGFRAAYFPEYVTCTSKDTGELAKIREAFEKRDIVIGELGAWGNPFHPDPETAKENVAYIIDRLAMADEVGARCAAQMVGNRLAGTPAGLGPENMSDEFYALSVDMTRHIVDQVKPRRAKLGFETFPFNFLYSTDMYEKYLMDINRPQYVTAHLDAINLISSPLLYFSNGAVMRDAVKRLAPFGIAAMHLKDLIMHPREPNTHLEEVALGQGGLDIRALLKAVQEFLPVDTPVLMEHLPDAQYDEVLPVVVEMGESVGVEFV